MSARWVVSAALLTALSAPASAAIVGNAANGLVALRELNVFTYGNLTSKSDIEGKAFVGGNLAGTSQVGIGSKASQQRTASDATKPLQGFQANTRATLTVYGNTTDNMKVNNGRNGSATTGALVDAGSSVRARIGGTATGLGINDTPASGYALAQVGGTFNAQNFNPSSTKRAEYYGGVTGLNAQDLPYVKYNASLSSLQQTIGTERDQLMADFLSLSTELSKLAATSSVVTTNQGNNVTFKAVADATGKYAVFNIADGATFFNNQNGTIYYDIPKLADGTYLTTIINVYGKNITGKMNSNNSDHNQYVIWNFVDALTLDLTRQLNGSVLATKATLSNSTPIEGSVVANVFNQNGEVHLGTFNGVGTFLTPQQAVPEPATWAMMVLGFGAIGAAIRRRKAAPAFS